MYVCTDVLFTMRRYHRNVKCVCICVYVYVCMYMCVCVCVCTCAHVRAAVPHWGVLGSRAVVGSVLCASIEITASNAALSGDLGMISTFLRPHRHLPALRYPTSLPLHALRCHTNIDPSLGINEMGVSCNIPES